MGTENRREQELVPHVRPGNIKTTTYAMLEADGDTTTELQPLSLDVVLAEFAERSHGHVMRREDGIQARCGGPSMCEWCKVERRIVEVVTTIGGSR